MIMISLRARKTGYEYSATKGVPILLDVVNYIVSKCVLPVTPFPFWPFKRLKFLPF
jgi:hypothetical protein